MVGECRAEHVPTVRRPPRRRCRRAACRWYRSATVSHARQADVRGRVRLPTPTTLLRRRVHLPAHRLRGGGDAAAPRRNLHRNDRGAAGGDGAPRPPVPRDAGGAAAVDGGSGVAGTGGGSPATLFHVADHGRQGHPPRGCAGRVDCAAVGVAAVRRTVSFGGAVGRRLCCAVVLVEDERAATRPANTLPLPFPLRGRCQRGRRVFRAGEGAFRIGADGPPKIAGSVTAGAPPALLRSVLLDGSAEPCPVNCRTGRARWLGSAVTPYMR